MMSRPLFVSYVGEINGINSRGWVVLTDHPPLSTPEDMIALVDNLEKTRNYDAGTLVLVNFQRLENPQS